MDHSKMRGWAPLDHLVRVPAACLVAAGVSHKSVVSSAVVLENCGKD